MRKKPQYNHVTEPCYQMMKSINPGSLLRVRWIEDTDDVYGAEWGLNMHHLDDENNVVMLIKWNPDIPEARGIVNFTCLWEAKLYSSSTHALIEVFQK